MAGIGFVLRKLSQQDNLVGFVRAYFNSAILATGPWIFTIVAFWAIISIVNMTLPPSEIFNFKVIVCYNFSFSAVLCGLITLVSTRHVADCIFQKDTSPIPGMMLGSIVIALLIQTPVAVWFYFFYAKIDYKLALLAVINYQIISLIWITSVYLTAIKNYHAITIAFGGGLAIAVLMAYILGIHFKVYGVTAGFNIGLGCCLALILASILSEYPFQFCSPLSIFKFAARFWLLLLSGLVYNIAIWIDKWIMWFAPDATVADTGVRINPSYDSAMFLAFLMIIPALGAFIFSLETSFHEKYLKFYGDINKKVNFAQIESNQLDLMTTTKKSINHFVAFQGLFTIVVVLLAPRLFELLDISFLRLGIFRFGVIGVFFHMLLLFLTIILSYFDCKKSILLIQTVFLVLNATLTYYTMTTGFVYYGLGYLLAAMISFALAAVLTISYMRRLPYHTFISNNTSI